MNGDENAPANWQASLEQGGSPGLANAISTNSSPVRLNEIMTDNIAGLENGGSHPDWIELYNDSNSAVNLAGWSLSDDSNPRKFVFPAGVSIAAHGYLILYCDASTAAPGIHTGFALGSKSGSLYLYDATEKRIDVVTYGAQLADFSIGRAGADNSWQLTQPTPGAANNPAPITVANPAINEFMANPVPGQPDWIELFNPDPALPMAIGGVYLASSNALSRLPALSFLPANGFVQLFADESAAARASEFQITGQRWRGRALRCDRC